MDGHGEFSLLTDEKFDFDISLSPTSAKEDNEDCDDEVFIGPVKHKEKCVSAAIASRESDEKTPLQINDKAIWSPLSGDKFVEIFKEAHLLALQLECLASEDQKREQAEQTANSHVMEKFVQESKSKLKLLEAGFECNKTPVALKRETYCVQESPYHQLPPSVQQRLAVSSTDHGKQSGAESSKQCSPIRALKQTKPFSVSPLAQKTKALQPKSNVPAANGNKPTLSRLQNTKTSTMHQQKNFLTVEKPKISKKQSPVRQKHLNSADSIEDLLSDKSSIASDVSDTSINTSIVGQTKRTLQAPSKSNLKTDFKAPGYGAFRRNTSSSSSSHSSINTSLNSSSAFSPPAGNAKLNASLNTSINGCKLKTNSSRLALARPTGGSASSLKTSSTDLSNPLSRQTSAAKVKVAVIGNKPSAVSVGQPRTPAGKFLRQTSAPNLLRFPTQTKAENAVKGVAGSKPQARVLPTPTSRLKLPQKPGAMSPDRSVVKTMQPTRLLSCGDIRSVNAQSTPLKDKPGTQPSVGKTISATPSTKRLSALPTPLNRRTSSVLTTPRTIPRSFAFVRQTPAQSVSTKSSAVKPHLPRNGEYEGNGMHAPISPSSPTEEENSTPDVVPCFLSFSPENKPVCGKESEMEKPLPAPTTETLLIDIGIENNEIDIKVRKPSLVEFDSQPLIDLSNTPECNRRTGHPKSAHIGQLIDLSSPLIKLSPVVNKENMDFDSPLLKF
ncbi:Hypothetical predicted protein [Pelobates cultripes]|uniref:G2 and S phase-expressed protein 1 N-terminal domain-containing protein n=2 Tax=Pelobates cultripes TaxID=61616 RepID=A0AAD1RY28_PELCU|nr:Hypothetical predicted protein [Pelobates cultripes]